MSQPSLTWEVIDYHHDPYTDGDKIRVSADRTKVPGGWLVRSHHDDCRGVAFVPDPAHAWDGKSLD